MIYTVTFNPSLDYVMFIPSLNIGGITRASRESIFPGGKGINVAVVLERLGFPCTALGFCAGYTGKMLQDMLNGYISHTDFINLPEGQSRINVKLKFKEESDINGRGPIIPTANIEELLKKLDELKEGDILVLSGNVPAGIDSGIYARILQNLQNCGVQFVVDTEGQYLYKTLPYKPFLVKPNTAELAALFQVQIDSEAKLIHYAKQLQKEGAQNVLVSRGEEGALLVSAEGKLYSAPAVKLKTPVVNSVGAGDSMVAGFLAGWLKSKDYTTALNYALAAGGACVACEWLPKQKDILAFL